jgi:hypothetical protein
MRRLFNVDVPDINVHAWVSLVWFAIVEWHPTYRVMRQLEFNNIFHKTLLILTNFTKLICVGSQLKSGRNFIIIGLVYRINGINI